MTDYVLMDDFSALGIRRVHVMSPVEVDQTPYVEMMQAEDGETVMVMLWKDELDNHHLYLAWRLNMNSYPMWCVTVDGDLAGAVQKAARRYQVRFGRWPNRAHIRQAADLPKGVELRGEQGEVLTRVDFAPVEKCWQMNVVGVFYQEGEHGE